MIKVKGRVVGMQEGLEYTSKAGQKVKFNEIQLFGPGLERGVRKAVLYTIQAPRIPAGLKMESEAELEVMVRAFGGNIRFELPNL